MNYFVSLQRLGRVSRTISGTGFPHIHQGETSGDFPFVKVSDLSLSVNGQGIVAASNWVSNGVRIHLGARVVPPGAIVFPKVGAALLSNRRSLTLRSCLLDNNLMAVVPSGGDPRFWRYVLLTVDLGELSGGGPLPYVSDSQIRDLRLTIPAVEEQRRIADFLDAETALLDHLIEKTRTQLTLLEERELADVYAAISGARTSGARKPSGLEWLGEVPIDWPVASVSSQFQVQLGKMLNQERTRGARLRPYLRVLNVQWDHIDVTELVEMDFPGSERARYEVLPGDLLICEGGSYPGRAAIWDGKIHEIYYQKALHRARARGRSSVRWLYYCLRLALAMGVFHAEGNSSTITHLTGEQLASRRFPFPEPQVQQDLVAELDAEGERRKLLREVREEQISLLEERRRAVVAAAVTGELDVTTARRVS